MVPVFWFPALSVAVKRKTYRPLRAPLLAPVATAVTEYVFDAPAVIVPKLIVPPGPETWVHATGVVKAMPLPASAAVAVRVTWELTVTSAGKVMAGAVSSTKKVLLVAAGAAVP